MIKTQSCDNFSLEYYRTDGGNYEGVQRAFEILRAFAEGFEKDNFRNHLLIGGTGLGLSIVKRGVIYHGGDLSIQSEIGKGTTIFVVLNKKLIIEG